MISHFTPLPTQYSETPVNAENVQNWAYLTGALEKADLRSTFAATGVFNALATITHTL